VGKEPVVEETTKSFKDWQALVGGYVEKIQMTARLALMVNEEGCVRGLPVNRFFGGTVPIVGDAFIMGTVNGAGAQRSLTDEECAELVERYTLK
jgi:hypothetical protein